MKYILRIARTELQTLFYSPIAWFILIVFMFQGAMSFIDLIQGFVRTKALGYAIWNLTIRTFANNGCTFASMQQYLFFYIPLLTMGMMSKELSSGSIKLLYSSPVTNTQIILGKFLSIMIYGAIMVGSLAVFAIYGGIIIDNFDVPVVLSGLLGLYLLICAYGAVGLFMSSLTQYQVIAAMGSILILGFLSYVNQMWQDVAVVRDITYWLSINGRTGELIRGLICSEDVIYFLTVISLFIGLTILRLKSIRQKTPMLKAAGRYVLCTLAALVVGYISSRPTLMCYYDTTRNKVRTLTVGSQKVLEKLKDKKITIHSYTNILDVQERVWIGLPEDELRDFGRLKQYIRFKPDLKIEYVRYYAKGKNQKALDEHYPNLSDHDRMVKIASTHSVDSSLFLDFSEVMKKENVAIEGNTYFKTLTSNDGKKSVLRIYNDISMFPDEAEITASFMGLTDTLPKIGFVTGHGERNIIRKGDREYSIFANERSFRYSLINQGFLKDTLCLVTPVPEDIDIMVISEMKQPMTDLEITNLQKYIDRGGNLIVMGEPRRQELMNPLLAQFGVRMLPGRLVQPSENFQPDFIVSQLHPDADTLSFKLKIMRKYEYTVTTPSVCALEITPTKDYEVHKVLYADTVWNEQQTQNFIDETPKIDPESGEAMRNGLTTMVALSRRVNGKKQCILISGDSDCISNGEISISREDVGSANYNLILGAFHWMSDGRLPVDTRRKNATDNSIIIESTGLYIAKALFWFVFPAILLFCSIFIWLRRRGR